MRLHWCTFIAHAILALCSIVPRQDVGRSTFNFNSDWRIYRGEIDEPYKIDFDDGDWESVTLPHAWNEDDAFKEDIKNLGTGIAWYRKEFTLPAGSDDKKVYLEFEGIRQGGEFYFNEKWVGRSENGVSAFGFDVTDLVQLNGTNVVAAMTDNRWLYTEKETDTKFQWHDKNFNANYGGINKNVYLHVTNPLHQTLPLYSSLNTTGVYVYADDIDVAKKSATIHAESEVKNAASKSAEFEYRVTVKNPEGKVVADFSGGKHTVAANETVTVKASQEGSNLNFWSWGYGYLYTVDTSLVVDGKLVDTITTKTGFRKTEFADGMVKLNDRTLQVKGYAQRTTNEWPAVGNAVPPWLSDFSNNLILGSNGNLVRWMHTAPWRQDVLSCDRIGLLQSVPAGDSEKDAEGRQWEQRVELMRDVVVYYRNNPSVIFYESGNEDISEEHMSEMKAIRDQFDPKGGRAAGSREMLDSTVAEYGGEMLYINKGANIPFWAMEYSRDENLRKYWDNYTPPYHPDGEGPLYNDADASAYNRNQDSMAVENVQRWVDYYVNRPGTGKRVSSGGVNIIFSDSNTHHRGAENYRRSGEVDAMRIPKDAYHSHRVMWNNWVDLETTDIHIVGHWNYNETTVKNITVVSSAAKVELFLNDKSLGFGIQSDVFLFTFVDVGWKAGTLKAVGYDDKGKSAATDVRETSGTPAAIKLTSKISPSGFVADGADLALVDVEVVDSEGRRCPTALNLIQFSLDGEATWRGGIAQGDENYILSKDLPVENGVNRVMIRSTTKAGKITVGATSDGLKGAEVQLETKSFKTEGGLAASIPGADLAASLARGPTPKGESYKEKRIALEVSKAEAGSSVDSTPERSYDDNELTSWTSESDESVAWIKYSLAAEAEVYSVVLKLKNFNKSTYDLKIQVGDNVVWEGTTKTTLGYEIIEFKPTLGSTVTITRTDGALAITEAELYAPVD
ncbi:putative cell-associated beta-galactosidase [Colletotrichum karsti]|uniref:Cell-associated beta-galactosidase n=1 Tax=Colletotrichum karsti TaxID=1095194 RepID=A0A9P6LGA9_9PEZI|nr:putative cell-associated beta-galactosidase [Colletotrichum karsti]KAF9872338.1 putative cell-associated beta-galactosidase [Colletotrichum karsti]